MEQHLTTRQVAEALSVSESSVKRWCDSGAIPTVRTVGGHRRIPMPGFLRFLEESKQQVRVPLVKDPEPLSPSTAEKPAGDLPRQFVAALAQGDEDRCREVLSRHYAHRQSIAELADEFVAEAFHVLGDKWTCGEIEVYQERRGCEIVSRLMHEFRRLIPEPAARAPLALGGAPAHDYYSLPTQLVDLVLRECGWRSMNLGSNLPLSTIAAAVEEHRPRLLWLSVSHLVDPHAFVEEYQSFRKGLPSDLMVVIGGRALTDELRPHLDYTGHCDNMQQLASLASAVHASRPG